MSNILQNRVLPYAVAAISISIVTVMLEPIRAHINATTVALALLLVVLFIATLWGSKPALFASLLGMFSFNFFFLPPIRTLAIAEPENWVALTAFLLTAITAGQLSARAKRRAEEAEAGRHEIERLYEELREAFARASHAEALRESECLKSALLDAVTHDLRTPLTSIKASVTTLLEDTGEPLGDAALDAEGRRELLEVINEESDRLNRFVEGLVELARIEAGEMRLRRSWGDVDEIIQQALARAQPLTARHLIEVEIERELPAVRIDARAVAEVVYTLIDNATKYAPEGTHVRVTANRAPLEMIRISVEDEGRGIPAEMRERVFDKFFRATEDTSGNDLKRPAGIGMGLSIARGLVEAHGGSIWIEDGAKGRGARVVFTVPVEDKEQGAVEQATKQA